MFTEQPIITDSQVIIKGTKTHEDGSKDVSCLVTLNKYDGTVEIARTITDRFGKFKFVFGVGQIPAGVYKIGFNTRKGKADTFWEFIEITSTPNSVYDNTPPINTTGAKLSHII